LYTIFFRENRSPEAGTFAEAGSYKSQHPFTFCLPLRPFAATSHLTKPSAKKSGRTPLKNIVERACRSHEAKELAL